MIWYFYLLCVIVILLLTPLTTYLLVCLLQGIGLQSTVLDIGYANSVMFCKIHKAIYKRQARKTKCHKCFIRSFIWLILFACLDKIRVDSPCKSTCEAVWNDQFVNIDGWTSFFTTVRRHSIPLKCLPTMLHFGAADTLVLERVLKPLVNYILICLRTAWQVMLLLIHFANWTSILPI